MWASGVEQRTVAGGHFGGPLERAGLRFCGPAAWQLLRVLAAAQDTGGRRWPAAVSHSGIDISRLDTSGGIDTIGGIDTVFAARQPLRTLAAAQDIGG